jgi:NTE family protein
MKMDVDLFVKNDRVQRALGRLQSGWETRKIQVSDIVDGRGHQYVDLVMEGGGVLGIALVGYTYALESVGIRFLGVGGTSAGAINAIMVAAADSPRNPKSEKILQVLAELNMFDFVDGDADARDFVRAIIEEAKIVKLTWKAMQIIDNMLEDLGLNPGEEFLKWLSSRLRSFGIKNMDDLHKRLAALPDDLQTRAGQQMGLAEAGSRLAIVSADVSTETKVVFPDMAGLYFANPQKVNPARFVRASMSIPGFFHPYRVTRIPKGPAAVKNWSKQAGYRGKLPTEVFFVDGGIMSNFPIDLFHAAGVPLAPTFGARLGTDRTAPHVIKKPSQLLGAVFNAARHCADYDFIIKNPDYRKLLTNINTGQHNWLNFFMQDQDKVDLFVRGVEAATDFLLQFDWSSYKKLREKMAA